MVFFFASIYFFISSFFYSTGSVIFLLGFAFAGAFIGHFASNNPKGDISLSFLDDPRKSFFSILVLVFVMMGSAALSFEYMTRVISVHYLQNTIMAVNVADAESNIAKAISLYSNDLYFRTYSQVYIAKLNSLAAKSGASPSDSDKAALQSSLDQAISGAQAAISYDSTNYLNYKTLGSVYDVAQSLGISGAGDKAIAAYKTASTLNPQNPGLKLALAHDSFVAGNMQDAKNYANQALSLKSDYIDALLTLSQIATKEGNNNDAIAYASQALALSPQDKNLAQYVDSLKNPSSNPPVNPIVTNPKKK
jgi:tetratricopeptide (TPR) repeat protein